MREIVSRLSEFLQERRIYQGFNAVRREVHRKMDAEIVERMRNNPALTETEDKLGAFEEILEHQVRDAVLKFNRKGYTTYSSGFFGKHHEEQAIAGFFELDAETQEKLALHGVKVGTSKAFGKDIPDTDIEFKPREPDLAKIKEKWDLIAALLPDKGQPALPNFTDYAVQFRKRYAPHSPYLEEWQAQIMGNPPEPKNNPKNPVWILVTAILTAI